MVVLRAANRPITSALSTCSLNERTKHARTSKKSKKSEDKNQQEDNTRRKHETEQSSHLLGRALPTLTCGDFLHNLTSTERSRDGNERTNKQTERLEEAEQQKKKERRKKSET
jgi:hypothetical protein